MKLKPNETIILKSVGSNYNNFKYPKRGWVEAPDWVANVKCGNGLHGNEWGKAGYDLRVHGDKFAVIKVNKDDGFINIVDKCKFRKGYVIATFSELIKAYNYIRSYKPEDVYFNFDMQVGGDDSTQKAGHNSTQKAGHYSTQSAGRCSFQTAGHHSTQISDANSTQISDHQSTQIAGEWSTQTAGNYSVQTAGNCSVQTAGEYSIHNIYGRNCMIKLARYSILIMHIRNDTLVFTDEDLPINEWVSIKVEVED